MLKGKKFPTRRELLCGTALFTVTVLSERVAAQNLEATYYFLQLTDPGAVFQLPGVAESVGVLGCSDLKALATAYRDACSSLNDNKLSEIKTVLTRLTQNEVMKLQNSVDLSDGKRLAERIGQLDGILTATIGLCVIGAALSSGPAVAFFGAASLIYGLGISPTVKIVKTAIANGQGIDIFWSWAGGRGTAVALHTAEALAEQKGKIALKGLLNYGSAVVDVFTGMSDVIQGFSNIQDLENKVNAAAKRALEMQVSFLPVLQDKAALKNMLCTTAEASAKALEDYASANAASDCRTPLLNIHFINIRESAVIVLP